MSIVIKLSEAHQDIAEVMTQIKMHLDKENLAQNPQEARSLVSKLAGKLMIHLAMEDKYLYPKFLDHSNHDIKSLTQGFVSEMGSIAETFKLYSNKWLAKLIKEDSEGFISETQTVFKVLEDRISREEHDLYPRLKEFV